MSDDSPTVDERLATLEDRLEFLMGHQHSITGMGTVTGRPVHYGADHYAD